MKKQLNIGSLKLPKESATKGFGFIGKRGSGKSYGAAVFAEELHAAGIPFVVFDPIDVWWGLKVAADGKGKGLPVVVFGKEHADIQLDRSMGKKIAEAVVKDNISCVISTFGMNKTEMREVVADFSERLLQINNTPRQVIIEEAHEFVPQRVMGAAAKCFSAVEALLVMGRNRGIGVTLLNQRMATLNKDLLTQIDVLVAFRSVGPQDRKAFQDWVQAHNDENEDNYDEFMKTVPSLKTGDAWIWSPEFLELFEKVTFRKRQTFHPDREKLGMTFKMPEIKQGDIQSFIDSFAKKPEAKKIVGSSLKPIMNAESVALHVVDGALRKAEIFHKKEMEKAVNEATSRRDKEWEEAYRILWMTMQNNLNSSIGDLKRLQKPDIKKQIPTHLIVDKKTMSKPLTVITNTIPKISAKNIDEIIEGIPEDPLSKPEQRILDTIAWFKTVGIEQPSKTAVAIMVKYRPTSGGYQNYLSKLRMRGLIEYPSGGMVCLTDVGMMVAHAADMGVSSNEEFQTYILNVLKPSEQNVLKPLLEAYPNDMTKDELAELTPYQATSGGYQNILSILRTLGFIDYPRPGRVVVLPVMFPFE